MSDESLKKACQHWSPSEWEKYLQSIETERVEELLDDPNDAQQVPATEYARAVFAPSEIASYPYLAAAVQLTLAVLGKSERRIIHMRYWRVMTWPEIARHLAISENTARTHLKRGQTKIKAALKAMASAAAAHGDRDRVESP